MKKTGKRMAAIVGMLFAAVLILCWKGSLGSVQAAEPVDSYDALLEYVDSCNEGGAMEVQLTGPMDVTQTGAALKKGTLTIDLCGNSMTGAIANGNFLEVDGGTLVIKDSKEGGAITNTGKAGSVIDATSGTLKVIGGNLTSSQYICINVGDSSLQSGSDVILSGGSFKGAMAAVRMGNNSSLTVSGDAELFGISANSAALMMTPDASNSAVTISGGTFHSGAGDNAEYACYFTGNDSTLTISGGTFYLHATQGSSLVIGSNVSDEAVTISGGTFYGRIARLLPRGSTGVDYTAYYGDGSEGSGILARGYVLTDNYIADVEPQEYTAFSVANVEVVPGTLVRFDTCLSSLYQSYGMEVDTDLSALLPVSVGTKKTVYPNSGTAPKPEATIQGDVYTWNSWADDAGNLYTSVQDYVDKAVTLDTTDVFLQAVYQVEASTTQGLLNALGKQGSMVKDVTLAQDLILTTLSEIDGNLLPSATRTLDLNTHTITAPTDYKYPALLLSGDWTVKNGTIIAEGQACIQAEGKIVLENLKCTAKNFPYAVGFTNLTSSSAHRILSGTFEVTGTDGCALWTMHANAEETATAADIINLLTDAYASSTKTRLEGANAYLDAPKLIVSQSPITYPDTGAEVSLGSIAYGESISSLSQTLSNQEYIGDIVVTGVTVDNAAFTVTGESGKTLEGGSLDTYNYVVAAAGRPTPGTYEGTVCVHYTKMDGTAGSFEQKAVMTVEAKQLTITEPTLIRTKNYDGTASAQVTPGALTGVVTGEDVTVTATAVYDSAMIGTDKTITVSYALIGADKDKYLAPADMTYSDGVILAGTNITANGRRALVAGMQYKLGSGQWTVTGDSTVYNGGSNFYVLTDSEYEFCQKP